MANTIKFRLITGKKEGTYTLRGGKATKNGKLKFIGYFPGGDSHFVEDNKDNDIQEESVVFRYNDILNDPAVEIDVNEDDDVLLSYLKSHALFGRHFIIYNEDEVANRKSKESDKVFEALRLISEATEVEAKAMAVAIFGMKYFSESNSICVADLKEQARTSPGFILDKYNADTYTSIYMAAYAYTAKIVKNTDDNTAVVWNDANEGQIVHVATGQLPLDKLAEHLRSNDGEATLQEIGKKIQSTVTKKESTEENSSKIISEKDDEIAKLKAQLAAQKTNSVPSNKEVIGMSEENLQALELEELQEEYIKVTGKGLPPAQKTDKSWLIKKIIEVNPS
jgi:hypothetical protein